MYSDMYYDSVTTAFATGTLAVYAVISLVIGIIALIAMWKIFVKAGKPGWAAIIPFYSWYCMFDIAFGKGWLFLLCFVPCVNFVIIIMYNIKLAKAFGRGTAFGVGLLFLPLIFTMILGFGQARYIGPDKK